MITRPAQAADVPAIVAIDAHGRATPRPTALFEAALHRLLVLADPAGEVVGFAEVHLLFEDAELIDIAIAPAARRRGLGRQLLAAVLAHARAGQAQRVLLEVRPHNAPAIGLYEATGFVRTGRRRAYYADGEDALLYERALSPQNPIES